MDLQTRISAALERELSAIYEELKINSGDISPFDLREWDRITADAAALFSRLIETNK